MRAQQGDQPLVGIAHSAPTVCGVSAGCSPLTGRRCPETPTMSNDGGLGARPGLHPLAWDPFTVLCAPALWLPCPFVPHTTLLGGPFSAEEAALAHRARAPRGYIPAGQPFTED